MGEAAEPLEPRPRRGRPSLEERAREGARFLDKHEPGWAQRVDLTMLDMSDETTCILGQLYGDTDKARLAHRWQPLGPAVVKYGFFLHESEELEDYYELQEYWEREIEERRAGREVEP